MCCFGHISGVCWAFTITGQVEIRVRSSREFPRHKFTSGDGHLGHETDSVPLTDGQRSGVKTGNKVSPRETQIGKSLGK